MDVDFDDNDISFSSDVLKRLKKIKPSAYSSSWSSIQGVHPVVLNHRPAQAYDIPIYLYHPIFSDFMALCESCQVDVQDEKFAIDISTEMCKAFDNEDKRKMAFIDLVRNYLTNYSFNANKIGAYETDGHITVTIEGEDIILAILEVKPEFGKGHGCAFLQATAYYSQHVVDASENQLKYYQKTCCPVFILYLAGPFLGFAGAICTDLPICDPLGPVIPLFYLPNEYPTMLRMARTFKAFKQSIYNLHESYRQKLSASDNSVRWEAAFPYVREFCSLGSASNPTSFTYIRRLIDKKPLYVAKTADRLVFVKFTMRYGLQAHVDAAEKGFAPALLGFDELNRGWKMVVMEYLPDNEWRMLTDVDDRVGVKDNVVTVMNSFHDLGYAHGDLRGENIMIADDGRVKIVDFDWAGLAGQIQYPHFMNPEIRWHINAQPAKPIQTEHDVHLLNSYFI